MLSSKDQPKIYHINLEEYVKPKKKRQLQFDQRQRIHGKYKPERRLKLLEHPVLMLERRSNKWQGLQRKCNNLHRQCKNFSSKMWQSIMQRKKCQHPTKSGDNVFKTSYKLSKIMRLPGFLAFLRARNDDGLCKRKTGFEIYCEMASIHGFANFVGAKTWERVFWCLVVACAVLMSTIVVIMSHYLNMDTPVVMYTESTHHPASTIPFPAVTICNLNQISRYRSEKLAEKFISSTNLTNQQLLKLFSVIPYQTDEFNTKYQEFTVLQDLLDRNDYTLEELRDEISPDCASELIRCKWKGRMQPCEKLFQKVKTPQGDCCAFNYYNSYEGYQNFSSFSPFHISSCGYKSGLTLLLNPRVEDYMASTLPMAGYQVLIHDALDFAANNIERQLVPARTETSISVVPQTTIGTDYLRKERVDIRRCVFSDERKLLFFANYTQSNCLSECRSQMMTRECGCIPAYWPGWNANGSYATCRLDQAACIVEHKDIFHRLLTTQSSQNYKEDRYSELFICDCYPLCSSNKYTSSMEMATLNISYSRGNKNFFKNLTITNHILLHVYYGSLVAQKFRLDVQENWLSFVSTFGGIAGLHMGYSFISGFEMIFFVFVRPLCNWLTKKQIQYRVKRNQRKEAMAAVKKSLEKKQRQQSEVVDTVVKAIPSMKSVSGEDMKPNV